MAKPFALFLLFAVLCSCCTNYVTTANVNNRTGPGTSYSIKKTFTTGSTVCVASISNDWAKLSDGSYVSASYIKIVASSCTNYVTTTSVNNRSGPGTNYSVKKTFAAGATVCVKSISNGWALLSDGSYVSATYIKAPGSTPTSSSSSTAKPISNTKVSQISFNYAAPNTGSLSKYTLWATAYYTPIFVNNSGSFALRTRSESVIGKVSQRDWCDCAMQGSCVLDMGNGKTTGISYDGQTGSTVSCSAYYSLSGYQNCSIKFRASTGLFGDGAYAPVVPYKTVAVDRNNIALGTVLYIPSARGNTVTLPDGRKLTHDGYFLAGDTGGAIKTNHIDVYIGTVSPYKANPFSSWVKSTASSTFAAYRVTDSKIISEMQSFAKAFKN